jgi:N-carbamoylputrescine amidase
MNELRVSIVQSGGCGQDQAENVERLVGLIDEASAGGADLVVLPELATTPYMGATRDSQWYQWATTVPGPVTDRFADAAQRNGTAVIVGMYERSLSGNLYNSAVVIDADGNIVHGVRPDGSTIPAYRKTFLPSLVTTDIDVDEKFYFSPGDGPCVFDVARVRLGIVICYDRSFPELWQSLVRLGAEVIVPVVSSMGWREQRFVDELSIRAFETQTWVIASNRGGKETHAGLTNSFFGCSCVIDPTGEVVARAPAHSEPELVRTTIDLDAVALQRARFPLGRDKRWDLFDGSAS